MLTMYSQGPILKNNFITFITNKYIYVPMILWMGIQIFKVLYELITTKKLNFRRIIGAGGMPSSHSAVVASLTTLIGKNLGLGSPIFAVSFMYACIVIYDACGVRRAAGKQAKVLNELINTPGLTNIQKQEKLQEALGHTPKQVFVGIIIGIIFGLIF